MKIKNFLRRPVNVIVVVVLVIAGILPVLAPQVANAAQLEPRIIEMSDSNAGDTGVTYSVQFTFASSYTVKGIVVDFCSNDPIVGDATCTAPTGFNVGGTTPTFTTSGTIGSSGWTGTGSNLITGSAYRTLLLTDATGVAVTSASTATINLTNVTNPTAANTTFYARIVTYAASSGSNSPATYAPGSEGTYNDYGGIALSTASTITITSKVQEQITFCVFTNAAANCGAASGTSVLLGDTHGVLSTTNPFVDKNTQFYITTNAANGVNIRIKGNTLTSGSNTIPAVNSGSSTPATVSGGTAAFGLCAYGTSLTIATTYIGASSCSGLTQTAGTGSPASTGSTTFGFNTTNTATTYGDTLASTTGPLTQTEGTVAFMGSISNATTAGIYTTTITFIATGSY